VDDGGRVGRGGIELHSGIEFSVRITRGKKENFAVMARGNFVFGGLGRLNEERGGGLVPTGEIVKIGILPVCKSAWNAARKRQKEPQFRL